MKAYEYKNKIYLNADLVDEAICELEEPRNNLDPSDYIDFAMIWEYDVEKLDASSWETFKMWCMQEGLNLSHASVVDRYFKELEK